jgi:hypothetical protein
MNYRRGDNQDVITLSIERPLPPAYAPALLLVRYTAWLLTIGALAAAISHRLRLPTQPS